MSDSENFLSRWARRKREAAEKIEDRTAPQDAAVPMPGEAERLAESEKPQREARQRAVSVEPAFDLTSLPPIESITAGTDIRAFLAPGVPADLTRAALRRAWVADPAIRDFVGLSENSWDFNAPDGVPGFGPLQLTEELRQMVSRLFAPMPEDAATGTQTPAPAESASSRHSTEILAETEQLQDEARSITASAVADDAMNKGERSRTRDENDDGAQGGSGCAAMQQNEKDLENQPLGTKRPRGRALPR